MNFKNMPELEWPYGYAMALGATVLGTIATVWYFKKRKWF
jgi:magnesium transporter